MAQDTIQINLDDQGSQRCPYCHDPIQSGQTTVACRNCGSVHHQQCWQSKGGCATMNCGGREYASSTSQPQVVESVQAVQVDSAPPEISLSDLNAPAEPGEAGAQPTFSISEDDLRETIVIEESDLPSPPPPPPPPPPKPAEVPCTYCQQPIEADQPAVCCAKCKAPYHTECWNRLSKCATLNCTSHQHAPYSPGQQADAMQVTTDAADPTSHSQLRKLLRSMHVE